MGIISVVTSNPNGYEMRPPCGMYSVRVGETKNKLLEYRISLHLFQIHSGTIWHLEYRGNQRIQYFTAINQSLLPNILSEFEKCAIMC